jgi:hypothetical protein
MTIGPAGPAAATTRYQPADFALPPATAALIREAVPPNTALAYQSRWRSFDAWCRDAGRVPLPATEQTVAAYLTFLAVDRGLKATTADAHLTAIRAVHRGAGAPVPDGLAARKVVVAGQRREAAPAKPFPSWPETCPRSWRPATRAPRRGGATGPSSCSASPCWPAGPSWPRST